MSKAQSQQIDRHGEGSAEAALLERWSREFRQPLLRYFQRRVPEAIAPEDLVQDVFARLARRADLSDIDHIHGYIFRIASHVLSDCYAKSQRTPEIVDSFDESVHGQADLTPERVLMDREAFDLLIRGLYDLPEQTRHVFVLYHFENMRQKDIAAKLDMPVSTLEKHIARANKRLLCLLGRDT